MFESLKLLVIGVLFLFPNSIIGQGKSSLSFQKSPVRFECFTHQLKANGKTLSLLIPFNDKLVVTFEGFFEKKTILQEAVSHKLKIQRVSAGFHFFPFGGPKLLRIPLPQYRNGRWRFDLPPLSNSKVPWDRGPCSTPPFSALEGIFIGMHYSFKQTNLTSVFTLLNDEYIFTNRFLENQLYMSCGYLIRIHRLSVMLKAERTIFSSEFKLSVKQLLPNLPIRTSLSLGFNL